MEQIDDHYRSCSHFITKTLGYSYNEIQSVDFAIFFKWLDDAEKIQKELLKAYKNG